jgi:hypothetical protein
VAKVTPTISESLNYIPVDILRRIAEHLGYVGDMTSKAELLRELPRLITQSQLNGNIVQLSVTARNRLWLEVMATMPFLPELPITDEPDRATLDELMFAGLLLPQPNGPGEGHLVIPAELRTVLTEQFRKQIAERILKPSPQRKNARNRGETFYRNFLTLASLCARKRLRLTGQGRLFKRVRTELTELLDIPLAESDYYSPEEELFWLEQMGSYTGIISPVGESMRTTRAIFPWLNLTPRDRALDLMHIAMDHGPLSLALPLASRLIMCLDEGWLTPILVKEIAAELPGADNLKMAWRFLFLCGAITIGGDPVSIHLTPFGKSILDPAESYSPAYENDLIIQADFSVIAPKEMELGERWQLERIADLAAQDSVYRYKLTRDSVQRALESGMEKEQLLEYLRVHSRQPLPQSVEYTLQNWMDRYGRLQFMPAFLLISQDDDLMDEVQHLPAVAANLIRQISPNVWAVRRDGYEDMLNALVKAGYMPKIARPPQRLRVWDPNRLPEE